MSTNYSSAIDVVRQLKNKHGKCWTTISEKNAARMAAQNRFKTGLDIAKYTAAIMRKDMAEYDANPANYTQSLGCWHGFVAQQKMIAVKKHHGTTQKKLLIPFGLDGCCLAFRIGPFTRSVDARKNSRT